VRAPDLGRSTVIASRLGPVKRPYTRGARPARRAGRGMAGVAQAPTITSTIFCRWLMSIGLLIIVNGPISSAFAMRSESG
jgi:rRNA processing protein Gar1